MKKILILVFAVMLSSCSSDDSGNLTFNKDWSNPEYLKFVVTGMWGEGHYNENNKWLKLEVQYSFVFRTDNNFYLAVPDVNNPRRLTYVLLGNYKLFPKTEDTAAKIEVFSTADNIPSAVLYIDRLDKSMLYMTTKISDKDYYLRFKKM